LHGALQIEQTTRSRYHQVGILQLGNLQLVRHATNDVGHTQATAVLHQIDGVMGYLLGQFTGWANNQRAGCRCAEMARVGRVFALGALRRCLALGGGFCHGALVVVSLFGFGLCHLGQQCVQHRQQEGGGFATAGLAGDHQVNKT
jgi:hypothetical protein